MKQNNNKTIQNVSDSQHFTTKSEQFDSKSIKNIYTLGQDKLPPEIAEKIMTYQTASGGCGFELYGEHKNYEGRIGDLLIVTDTKMYIKRLYFGHLEPPRT